SMTQQEWTESVKNLNVDNFTEDITKTAVTVVTNTLDNFLQAFSLGFMNPLLNESTLEHSYLNDFVHPCLKTALYYCAKVYYTSGEIPSPHHIKRQKGDGIGLTTCANKYQIVYVEGTRPYKVDPKKILDNQNKIGKNLKSLFLEIMGDRVRTRRIIMPDMEVFGVSSAEHNLYMYVFGFSGNYYLQEVDSASVPRDFTEMEKFIFFYEAILKWA
ncbi:20464_t:CDS:2, partial [Dentiscutata erythropus]